MHGGTEDARTDDPGPPGGRPAATGSQASVAALEAVLAAIVLAAAAVAVITTMGPGSAGDRPETHALQTTAQDTLRVIAASEGNETRRARMATLVADAIHGRPGDLEERIHRTLPLGAGASLHLGNGLDEMTLLEDDGKPDSTTHARRPISPAWPTLHVVPDLRVYPAKVEAEMNVTALPLWAASPRSRSLLEEDNLSFPDGFEAPLDDDGDAPGTLANLSLPNATDDGSGGFPIEDQANITSNVTYRNTTLEGRAPYRTDTDDAFEDTHDAITSSLEDATLDVAGDADLDDETTVTWDFTPVTDAIGSETASGTESEVHVAAFRPIPRDEPALPGHVAAWDHAGEPVDGSRILSVDRAEIVGRWMVVAQLNVTLEGEGGSVNQSARLVDTFDVRVPGTTGDPTALYDLELVAWYEDW